MNDNLIASGRGLPLPALAVATAAFLVILIIALRQTQNRPHRFVIFAVWARFLMSAYHAFTYKKIAAGLSPNALGSIGILGVGLLIVNKRLLVTLPLASIYLMMGVVGVSGLVNGTFGGLITVATKMAYLLVIIVGLYEALARSGERKTLAPLVWAFIPLLVCQALSVALGVVKATESDGSTSYIGGYNHEAAFSVGLAGGLFTLCYAAGMNALLRNGLILISLVGLYLANYRTSIMAVGPLVFAYFALPELKRLYVEHQRLVRVGAVLVCLLGGLAMVMFLQDRFQDLTLALSNIDELIKPPQAYSGDDQRILSGRPFIWSIFIDAWLQGSDVTHLIGYGPESWTNAYSTYPHNTLVAHLYEYGWVGVAATLFMWASMLWYALRADGPYRSRLVAGHLSFFLLNMATMPQWMIEGNILYGVLCGLTLYNYKLARLHESKRLAAEALEPPLALRPRSGPSPDPYSA